LYTIYKLSRSYTHSSTYTITHKTNAQNIGNLKYI